MTGARRFRSRFAALAIPACSIACLVLALASASPSQQTLHVPAQYKTIQAAVNAAGADDTVLVAPGRYVENVVINSARITLKSSAGAAVTTIDGAKQGTVVRARFDGCLIEGFTITNGSLGGLELHASSARYNVITGNQGIMGGGIEPYGSPCYIEHNEITHNVASYHGGGVGWPSSTCCHVFVRDNYIAHNISQGAGGGVLLGYGSLVRNRIVGNTAATDGGGVHIDGYENYGLSDNIVYGNQAGRHGGGVYMDGYVGGFNYSSSHFTVVGNSAGVDGGGLWCRELRGVTLSDWILWNNQALRGAGPELWVGKASSIVIQHSVVKNGMSGVYVEKSLPPPYFNKLIWGAGMLTSDPRFVDEANGDLHLTANSPCVDAGSWAQGPTNRRDFEGNPRLSLLAVDIGADEFFPTGYSVGTPKPGGSATVVVIGPPQTPVLLGYSLAGRLLAPPVAIPGLGSFWLAPPFAVFSAGVTDAGGVFRLPVTVPASFPRPYDIFLQALSGQVLTDPWALKVR